MLKKLSYKIIISYVSLIAAMVLIVFLLLGSLLRETHISMTKKVMSGNAGLIELMLKKDKLKLSDKDLISRNISEFSSIMNLRITIVDLQGKVLADSDVPDAEEMDNHLYRPEINDAIKSGSGISIRYSSTLKTNMLYYASFNNDHVIRQAKPLYEVEESLASLKKMVFNVSWIVLFTAVIIIILISVKITRPLQETLDFASDFARGDYKRRIMNYSDDEIGNLQKSLNKMADTIVDTLNEHIFEKQKLETTIESISDGVAMISSEKRIQISNKSFSLMLNIDIESKNRPYFEIIRSRKLNNEIDKALKTGEKSVFDIEIGNGHFLEVRINPIEGKKSIKGILTVLHDVSERKKIEQIKSDLVSNVSHELKTPIAIIKGYLETIRNHPDDRELTGEYINRAIKNADRQNAIVDDIIKLSMVESPGEFQKELVDVKQVIERCLEIINPKITEKKITVTTQFSENADFKTYGNNFLAEEIFFNLIDNAVNYNNTEGTISIECEKKGESLIFKIADTGIGIPREVQGRIFERFYRVDKGRSRASGGTGLGLSIVKHAVQVMGWKISLDSDSSGTVFTIEV